MNIEVSDRCYDALKMFAEINGAPNLGVAIELLLLQAGQPIMDTLNVTSLNVEI